MFELLFNGLLGTIFDIFHLENLFVERIKNKVKDGYNVIKSAGPHEIHLVDATK